MVFELWGLCVVRQQVCEWVCRTEIVKCCQMSPVSPCLHQFPHTLNRLTRSARVSKQQIALDLSVLVLWLRLVAFTGRNCVFTCMSFGHQMWGAWFSQEALDSISRLQVSTDGYCVHRVLVTVFVSCTCCFSHWLHPLSVSVAQFTQLCKQCWYHLTVPVV